MLILAYDTSSPSASVAVLQDERILYDVIVNAGLNHSEVLLPAIEQACRQTKTRVADFDLFACTIGPGSFTGLRIGAGTMKGYMLATGKPGVGVSSLEALAMNAGASLRSVCAVMDAGQGQVYAAYFEIDEQGVPRQIGTDSVIHPSDIRYCSESKTVFVGSGALKNAEVIAGIAGEKIIILPDRQQAIRASSVGLLGLQKYMRQEVLDVDTFVPVYLRSSDVYDRK